MAMAMVYPEPEKRGGKADRGQSLKIKHCPVNAGSLSQARAVLANAFNNCSKIEPFTCRRQAGDGCGYGVSGAETRRADGQTDFFKN